MEPKNQELGLALVRAWSGRSNRWYWDIVSASWTQLHLLRIGSVLVMGYTSLHCGLSGVQPLLAVGYEPLYIYSTGNPHGASYSLFRLVLGCVLIALSFHPWAREGILLISLGLRHSLPYCSQLVKLGPWRGSKRRVVSEISVAKYESDIKTSAFEHWPDNELVLGAFAICRF